MNTIPRLTIRHVERQEDATQDIVQSTIRLVDQACTNRSGARNEIKWLQPFTKPVTNTASSVYTLRVPPPTRKSLLQTLSPVSPSHSLALLDWGAPPTEPESSGLSGLEEFTSGANWSVHRSSVVIQSRAKRQRSTEEPSIQASSSKRNRVAPANPTLPENPALLALSRLHVLTGQRGTARLRLGLRKRPPVGQEQPPGGPAHVKITSKRQLGPGPSRILITHPVQPASQLTPSTPRVTSLKGTVLVPASPSPVASRTAASSGRGDSWTSNRVAASVSYESSPDSSPKKPRSQILARLHSDDTSSENNSRAALLSKDPGSGDVVTGPAPAPTEQPLSGSLEQDERIHECSTNRHTRPYTAPRPGPTRIMTSVMYNSSQGSVGSPSGEPSKLHTSYGSLALPSSFDKEPSSQKANASGSWDLSLLPSSNPNPPSTEQIHTTTTSEVVSGAGDTTPQSNPRENFPSLDMISALYDSSQADPDLPGTQQSSQEPIPSWNTYQSSRNGTPRPLSGAQPSSSWSAPSVDGLVAASRSLSLEDFEHQVRRPSGNSPSLSEERSLSEKSLSHSQLELNRVKPILQTPRLMHPEVSRLASSTGSEDPIYSPSQPSKRSVDDDSIESINSPLPSRTGPRASVCRVPAFRLPGPEVEDDISFESYQAHKQTQIPPTPLGDSNSPIDSSTSGQRSSVPRFDVLPAPDGRSPRAGSTGEAEIKQAHNLSRSPIFSTPNNQTALNHPALGAAAPFAPPASKIYRGSLHKTIPQPHFFPSLPCPSPPLMEGMLAALEVSSVHAWFDEHGKPKLAPTEGFVCEPWKRVAWIIPVRGRPPWEGCSSAAISSRPIVKARKKRTILWTPAALRSLWTQLDGFRESKRVGPLSLSFEPAQADQAFEFVKVYHEARVSLKLRTILKVLEFRDCDGYGVDAEVSQEDEGELGGTRRLLGSSARLALLDEVGRIVLVS
ncbi:hypothetical protein FRC08_004634 [Ceratobasidium sp. 394]|nr:hypothetical protein FRC08_004634 [Ceratobasidium sp. 394]